MTEKRLKYLFYLTSLLLLIIIIVTSRDAGISCDEVLHYDHSVEVYNYFATHGRDTSSLNTPVTHLKYYGQSYDNLITILINWFGIEDVYTFRHLMSSVAGWLAILVTALFATWLMGYGTGITVMILFALSPTFIGHTYNNLKDIPFALGYIASTYFIMRFLFNGRKVSIAVAVLLMLSIAFSISIRAGGLIVICYLFLFTLIFFVNKYLEEKTIFYNDLRTKLMWITGICVTALLLSILLWPYALKNPLRNIIDSYHVMAHFPATFRQIFEGEVEWSDYMPWYYLPKSMAITIPFLVLTGLAGFIFSLKHFISRSNGIVYLLLVFTLLFPMFFVIYEKSNLYSSWRQFLFLYPAIVILSAAGIVHLFHLSVNRLYRLCLLAFLIILSFHPLKFMLSNHPNSYLYYNQFVGGTNGAYGRYELDYYYISQTEASEWLIDHLKEKQISGKVKVKATYSVNWQFRDHPEIETSYFRWEERSLSDWDYAIVVNRYIPPFQLKNQIWPPENAIHIIYADRVPICAVVERKTKDDLLGNNALEEGRYNDAINFYEKVLSDDDKDEMIFYNFAVALIETGQYQRADSVLKSGLLINPDFDPILMYLGNIARSQDRPDEAINYYKRLIKANRKYFEAYVELSKLLAVNDVAKARELLETCLTISPRYKPAIEALADTYRESNPEVAAKYDELAKSIE